MVTDPRPHPGRQQHFFFKSIRKKKTLDQAVSPTPTIMGRIFHADPCSISAEGEATSRGGEQDQLHLNWEPPPPRLTPYHALKGMERQNFRNPEKPIRTSNATTLHRRHGCCKPAEGTTVPIGGIPQDVANRPPHKLFGAKPQHPTREVLPQGRKRAENAANRNILRFQQTQPERSSVDVPPGAHSSVQAVHSKAQQSEKGIKAPRPCHFPPFPLCFSISF